MPGLYKQGLYDAFLDFQHINSVFLHLCFMVYFLKFGCPHPNLPPQGEGVSLPVVASEPQASVAISYITAVDLI